jgi:hypothetical protein
MLDRDVIEGFLDDEIAESEMKIPRGVKREALVETFCKYVEDDYYEWIKDNFKSFFNHGDPDWDWIKGRVAYYSKG